MTHLVPVLRPVLGSPFRRASLYRAAGEIPSWHIAPVRTGNVRDLVTGADLVTFTNSSPAWGFNSSGVLVQPAANVPFIEYDPATLQSLGWRIWGAVTNSIRNNTMQGAVAGTPGTLPTNWSTFTSLTGITRQIVGTGTENGITYIDVRLSGTPSAAGLYGIYFEQATQVVAASGQTWTSTSYVKLAAGSTTGVTEVRNTISENNSGGGFLAGSNTPFTPTSAALSTQRVSVTRTLNQATTAFIIPYWDVALTGAAIDITIRIGLPQLQQSATVGPVVKTSGMAASSTADVASITGSAFAGIYNSSEATLFARWSSAANATQRYILDVEQAASSSDRVDININTANAINPRTVVSGAAVASLTGGTYTANTIGAIAFGYRAGDYASSFNGASVVTDATAGSLPASPARLFIGSLNGLDYLNGYVREMATFKSRRPNANLQSMTQ